MVAAAGILGTASHAEAATSIYWYDSEPGYYRQAPVGPQRRHKAKRRQAPKSESATKEAVKPQGPLIVAISIERQSLKLYDANGLFAETPISTGMRGHPTPMGVFSVIQKHKFHRSNIYSGAPMPYMQRITWSGVAMHAGVLPGYPASHGCIRMPMSFAVKLWGWTRMGARVVVTPGEMTPSTFSHPLLSAPKPAPVAATTPSTAKSDKTMAAVTITPPIEAAAPVKPAQTADAGAVAVTMVDALPAASEPATADKPEGVAAVETKAEAATPVAAATESAPEATKESGKETDKSETADPKKDQARPTDAEKTVAKPDPAAAPKRSGQIAAFISRKDSKLYVRQNFAPLFETPVTIAPGDRPLGTHVFTAQADKDDPKSFHWSVVSLPTARHAERHDDDERALRRRKTVGAVEMKPAPSPNSPTEALDRISIPEDAMARIIEALTTGGSIVVSDQGIAAGETGEGTDFIVSLR